MFVLVRALFDVVDEDDDDDEGSISTIWESLGGLHKSKIG